MTQSAGKGRTILNAVVRSKGDKATYVGHEFDRCKDYASLHYRLPFEKVLYQPLGGPTFLFHLLSLGLCRGLGCTKSRVGQSFLRRNSRGKPLAPEDSVHSRLYSQVNLTQSSLLITEPYFNLPNIQEIYDQFVFEEYEFKSYHRCTRMSFARVVYNLSATYLPAASLVPHGTLFSGSDLPPAECMLIVDSGFSFTHVIPILNGTIVWKAVKRWDPVC